MKTDNAGERLRHNRIHKDQETHQESRRPETFRLPKAGGDPYFGFGRSFYYRGEQLGYWRLIRVRERGKLRGVTLVPYDEVAAFVRSQKGVESVAPSTTGHGAEEYTPGV